MDNRPIIVAFTGHRDYDNSANEALRDAITSLYNSGARVFRVGMAVGFDMTAAEFVIEHMAEHNDIVLEAYIPWPDFIEHFDDSNALRFNNIIIHCSRADFASEEFHKGVYHKRNDMLIEGADYLIAWWNGKSSGTGYTVKRARKKHLKILNLYPSQQMKLQL